MAMLVHDRSIERRIAPPRDPHDDRRKYHEVWDGVAYVPPLPNDEHQEIQFGFAIPLYETVIRGNLGAIRNGVNVSDRVRGWKKNFRIPDLAVYLHTTAAVNHGTHWVGGPDFMIEILSPGEDPTAKFDFYARIGTREILLIDREPWSIELHRLIDGRLAKVGQVALGSPDTIASIVLPLSFGLERRVSGRPMIILTNLESGMTWIV